MDRCFVRPLGVAVPATVVIMLIWAVFIVPGGAPWTGIAWFGGLPVLVVATAALLVGLARTPGHSARRSSPLTRAL